MVVMVAPIIAPVMVNISRYMATFMFVIPPLTYEAAEPLEVAIMATMADAIACFTGIPKSTRIGTSILAPPRPVSEPRKPTNTDMNASDAMFNIITGYYKGRALSKYNA